MASYDLFFTFAWAGESWMHRTLASRFLTRGWKGARVRVDAEGGGLKKHAGEGEFIPRRSEIVGSGVGEITWTRAFGGDVILRSSSSWSYLKLRFHYRLDSVHFGFWILKYHLDCSYWWICDLAVLDGWVIQVCKWVHSGWPFGHTPSRVIDFLLIIIIIRKLRSSYRLDGVLDGLFDWLEHAWWNIFVIRAKGRTGFVYIVVSHCKQSGLCLWDSCL